MSATRAGMVSATTRRVRVTMTRTMWVDLPPDEAEVVLQPGVDITDLSDHVARWQRIAAYDPQHIEADLAVDDGDGFDPWYAEPVNGNGQERYLWSARHFVGMARYELSSGRYREGHCPELDSVNGRLAVLEDELRMMALVIDRPDWPEVKAWLWVRWVTGFLARSVKPKARRVTQ